LKKKREEIAKKKAEAQAARAKAAGNGAIPSDDLLDEGEDT